MWKRISGYKLREGRARARQSEECPTRRAKHDPVCRAAAMINTTNNISDVTLSEIFLVDFEGLPALNFTINENPCRDS